MPLCPKADPESNGEGSWMNVFLQALELNIHMAVAQKHVPAWPPWQLEPKTKTCMACPIQNEAAYCFCKMWAVVLLLSWHVTLGIVFNFDTHFEGGGPYFDPHPRAKDVL